ncbi:translocation/assembly module TamB domain-containing protein [Flavihumibacter sp. ZG627]|uniref:translocation/assembly module TamB domain-containing protein n=1 Tax=Flavihumibacter sp. ZG627 TaxID=1463156 RepID=UPI00155B0254|nr:translocation/assembly module TamB domain-containing protein [Flavihumibacter sp. ZG627]
MTGLLALQTNPVQQYLQIKTEKFLEKKLGTNVNIGKLRISGFSQMTLETFTIFDQQENLLAFSDTLRIRFQLAPVLQNNLVINDIDWQNLLINVYTLPDERLSYQFIIDSLAEKPTGKVVDQSDSSSSTSLQFQVGKLKLRDLKLSYFDTKGGLASVISIGDLLVITDRMDVATGIYDLREVKIGKLNGFYTKKHITQKPLFEPVDSVAGALRLNSKSLLIAQSSFQYNDESNGIKTGWNLPRASFRLFSFDLNRQEINAGFIELNHPSGYVHRDARKDSVSTASGASWKVLSPVLDMRGGKFNFVDVQGKPSGYINAFEPSNFYFSPLNAIIRNLTYTDTLITGRIQKLELIEKSGFTIRRANGDFSYSDSEIWLNNLFLETKGSRIARMVQLTVPSWSDKNYAASSFGIRASLLSTKLQLSELLYFVPEFRNDRRYRKIWDKTIVVNGQINGTLDNLLLNGFSYSDNVGNRLSANGRVKNLQQPDLLFADLNGLNISTGNNALRAWLPDKSIPSNVSLPAVINIKGRFAGGLNDANTSIKLNTTYGFAEFSGNLKNYTDTANSNYDILISSLNMDVGKLIGDSYLGRIIANGKIKGKGYNIENLTANTSVFITSGFYKGHNYKNILVDATLDGGNYTAQVKSNDPDLTASFNLSGNITDGLPTINGKMKVDRVDVQALGFSKTPLLLKGDFDIDLRNTKPRQLEGEFFATHLQVSDGREVYTLDSIRIMAKAADYIQDIRFESPFGWATAVGNYDYTNVFSVINKILYKHILPLESQKTDTVDSQQQMELNASITWPRNLAKMLPLLEMKKPLTLKGKLDTDSSLLMVQATQPFFRYGEMAVDSTEVLFVTNIDSVHMFAGIASLEHPTVPLRKTKLEGGGTNGTINWELLLDDRNGAKKYQIGGDIAFLSKRDFDIHFAPEILLNKTSFETGTPNFVSIRNNRLATADLQLVSDSQKLVVATVASNENGLPPIKLSFDEFRLSTFSGLLERDTALISGFLNGTVRLSNLASSVIADGEVKIDSLKIKNHMMGILNAKISTPADGVYGIDANLAGNQNDVVIKARYGKEIDASIILNSLNLASAEAFTMGEVTAMSGITTGELNVTGAILTPQVRGTLKFMQAKATVSFLNTPVTIDNEEIFFNELGVGFQEFTLKDSVGGMVNINGYVLTKDYSDFEFDLDVDAENFMALGPKANTDQIFYGPAFIDSRIRITGNMDLPQVDMNVKLRDKSEVTFVIPDEEPGIANREGVIIFVDKDNIDDSSLITVKDTISLAPARLKGFEFSGNIEITPASTLRLVVDKFNGDFIEAKGNTSLNLTIDQGNHITMTGRYEIESGKYEMSLNQLIKRSFSIEKGSSITWNGDLLRAIMDITAKHTVNAPAIDLVEDQLTSTTANRMQYKQRIPVEIFLNIKDELLKPTISFRLDMPEKDRNIFNGSVYTRLKQINNIPSEINKQVMGLLVLQTFISDNPLAVFNDRSDGGIAFAAKQSISKILSQQINNLADNMIKGIDLNFDLQTREDYVTGARQESTSLSVSAGKSLLNERLYISIGSNVGILGNNPQAASALIGDVIIDYKISRDGRYKLRAYQINKTDVILEGQIIETGLSIMMVMDYNRFNEVFKKTKKLQETANRK